MTETEIELGHIRAGNTANLTVTHWGAYRAVTRDGRLIDLVPVETDDDPSPISKNMIDTLDASNRISRPMVRRGFLEGGAKARSGVRGADPFVEIDWDQAETLVANELARVKREHGNEAIFAGSYGWASAGRFHHAQSQIHRFMKLHGGYVDSVNTYSFGADEVILPHVFVDHWAMMGGAATSWPSIVQNSELVVSFGGLPLKNAQVSNGGTGRHVQRGYMRAARARGVRFVNISPLRGDMDDELNAEWIAVRPGSDVALMLGLAHTLVASALHDHSFLERYCVGFERFMPYLMGTTDGQPKDAEWAAAITELPAEQIRTLARDMAARRTMITASWSLQRSDHGEQSWWMALTLAAMLGQIGLLGGGVGFGYSSENAYGNHTGYFPWTALPQGENPVKRFIPVARIADMLLNPGDSFDYNGASYTYPDVRLVYWIGGNPFHHHQDLNRLLRAWQRPQTIIVHEPWWNPLAKHADIVLPATTTLERNDLFCTPIDGYAWPMKQVVEPRGAARNDFDIFTGIAHRLGIGEAFTGGRNEASWIRFLYEESARRGRERGIEFPSFEAFWENGFVVPPPEKPQVLLEGYRADPAASPLDTPSGRIEIFSETIESFGYPDCRGHPMWFEPAEWLGAPAANEHPLHLVSNQPRTKLHSQMDHGAYSRGDKVCGREAITMNPADAAQRGIGDGDLVRVFNRRGACFAGVRLSAGIRVGVVQMATGAWYDPAEPGHIGSVCKHGNVNVLTLDKGTSRLAQACAANACLVEVERWDEPAPPTTAFDPPEILKT